MNREEVAMNLTFENLDILRKEVQAAKLLLSECDKVLEEDGGVYIELRAFLSGKMSADDVIALLASQQGEQVKHPEQAEGAQGERERFEVEMLELCLPIERDSHGAYVSDHVRHLWSGWELRAALAQPSPAPELERPIAVAYRSSESGNLYEEHYGLKDPEPLMTVAQHDRIRAQDAAQIDAAAALLSFTRGKLVKLKSERDAAQDRVVELERQEPVATVCEVSMHHTGSTDVINTHLPCGTKLYANPVAQAGQVPLSLQFVNAVKQLCKDFADRQDRPYMGNVFSALDALLVNEQIPVAQVGKVPDALREAVEYLDSNPFNEIGSGSILHRQMRDAIAGAPAQGGCDD